MKILVIGLDCAAPELLLGDDRLSTIRSLMEAGCYGRLESVVPPITVPAWMCLATGQDPGSLGVYGFRNRTDHSYKGLGIVDARAITAPAIWDQVAREGGKSILVGVPPGFPPRKVNGISVGCFLTPDVSKGNYTHPPEVAATIERLVGDYPVDVRDFRTDDKARIRDEIFEMSRKQFTVVRHFLENEPWDYFHFVEIGLDRIHHGFWRYHDPEHVLHEPNSPFADVVRDYYLHLDEQIASVLELLTEDTVVLVVSDHGARRLDGGFCVNEWLVREGLLALRSYPEQVTPFAKLDVDWGKTTAWSEGGYYARVFLNVKGREPEGTIETADYERVRDEIKARFEATTDAEGKPLGTLVFKPEEIYRGVRNVAPDLIVHFGGLAWRSIGGVGYPAIHVRENDTGPDDCNHAQHGVFVLASPHLPPIGEIEGARLLDIAPTLLELGGYPPLPEAHGKSLVAGRGEGPGAGGGAAIDDDELVRERLRGLGYIG
jgi:predicted AlkP superfamily phosphohydrolase/phosphomutase